MRRFSPFNLTVFAFSLALFSTPAGAASVTESITISGTMHVGGTVATSHFPAFNPALGTLTAMSVHLSGTVNYSGKGLPVDEGAALELEDLFKLPVSELTSAHGAGLDTLLR